MTTEYKPLITLGNLIQIAVILVGGTLAFAAVNSQAAVNAENIAKAAASIAALESRTSTNIAALESRTSTSIAALEAKTAAVQVAQEGRLRATENGLARSEERWASVLQILNRIEAQIEKIDAVERKVGP